MTDLEELQASAIQLCRSALHQLQKTAPHPSCLGMAIEACNEAQALYAAQLEESGEYTRRDHAEYRGEVLSKELGS